MALDSPINHATLVTSGQPLTIMNDEPTKLLFGNATNVDHFVIDNQFGNSMNGQFSVVGFGKNDTFLARKKIFDGNNDNIIDFGDNARLDSERTSGSKAGDVAIGVIGDDTEAVTGLRYLGSKDGFFVYADKSVRLAGFTEGTVNSETFNAAGGAKTYFYDNALGLNLGGDTINNFGADDFLVTTKELFNRNAKDGAPVNTVTFGNNAVLDLSGNNGAQNTDPTLHPGGQIDFGGSIQGVSFDHSSVVGGVTYYYYTGWNPVV